MKFSIITPSLQRESLIKCCASVDAQTFKQWDHIVMLDVSEINDRIFCAIQHPNRRVMQCDYPHRNYGNTCRHKAWEHTTGDWLLHLDDDNSLSSNHVLEDIAECVEGGMFAGFDWAIFPILRHGHIFFSSSPSIGHVDTANIVARRAIGRWPNDLGHGENAVYTMDGHWVESMKAKHYPYAAFQAVDPIVVMEKSNEGK